MTDDDVEPDPEELFTYSLNMYSQCEKLQQKYKALKFELDLSEIIYEELK